MRYILDEAAYWLVPVHPQDRLLQGVQWKGRVYVDPMLPFGLRSAPKIFNVIADALEWTLRQQGIRYCEHYLDDFILLGSPDTQECQAALDTLDRVCGMLGVLMAAHKREGPTTCLIFLGVEIDTIEGTLRLPKEKLDRLGAFLTQWGDKKVCSVKEIQSLVGHLNHACKVVRPGRSFLRRMIDLCSSPSAFWTLFLQYIRMPKEKPGRHVTHTGKTSSIPGTALRD